MDETADNYFAAVLHGVNDLRVECWPPPPGPPALGCVRVAVKAVGICGSDLHYLKHGRIADFVVTTPMVIGHESAGVITEVGEGVGPSYGVGDPVALEPGVPCWSCEQSKEGRYNLDPDIKFFATPPVHGSLATYVDHPASLCFKLPEGMSLEEGAFCEPLSVGVHACRRGQVQPGKTVAVYGAGPIGLVTLLCAQAFGADQVIITDINPNNLQLAASHYKATTVLTSPQAPPEEVAAAVRAACSFSSSPHIVIDCAGFQQTVEAAARAVAPGGKVVLVGMGAERVELPAQLLSVKEVELLGSFRYANTYPVCINLLSTKRVDIKPLITHRFSFPEGVLAGFEAAASPGAIKVMFQL